MGKSRILFDSKYQGETVTLTFDFISLLGTSENINTKTVTASVWTGVDANPGNIISGAAASSGTQVTQNVTAGVVGVVYLLKCTIVTTLGQTLILEGLLYVAPDGP